MIIIKTTIIKNINMTLTTTQLFSDKTDKETAEAITNYIAEKVKNDIDTKVENLATKKDLVDTKLDMLKWSVRLCGRLEVPNHFYNQDHLHFLLRLLSRWLGLLE